MFFGSSLVNISLFGSFGFFLKLLDFPWVFIFDMSVKSRIRLVDFGTLTTKLPVALFYGVRRGSVC